MRKIIILTLLVSVTMAAPAEAGILRIIDNIFGYHHHGHKQTVVVHKVHPPKAVHKVHQPKVVHVVHKPVVIHKGPPPKHKVHHPPKHERHRR